MSMKHFGNTFTVTIFSCMADNSKIYCNINNTFRDVYRGKLEAIFREVGTPKKVNVMNHFVNFSPDREEILLPKPGLVKGNAVVILTNKSTVGTGRTVLDTVINAQGDHNIPVVMKILDDEDSFALRGHDVVASPLEISTTDSESERRRKISETVPSASRCFERQNKGRASMAHSRDPRREKSVADYKNILSTPRKSVPSLSMLRTQTVSRQKNGETVTQPFHDLKHEEETNKADLTCPLINHRGKYGTERNDSFKDNESCFESGSGQQNFNTYKHRNLSPSEVIQTESQNITKSPDPHTSCRKPIVLAVENVTNFRDKMSQRVSHMNERLLKLCEETSRVFMKMPEKRTAASPTETSRGHFPAFLCKHATKYAFFKRVNQGSKPVPQASDEHQNLETNPDDPKLASGSWNHDTKQNTLGSYKFPEILKMQHTKKQSHRGIDKREFIKPNASVTSDSSCNKLDNTLKAVFENLCEIVKQMHSSPGPDRRYTYTPQM